MARGRTIGIVVLVVVVLVALGLYGAVKGTYNSLVAMDERVKGDWAQVENQLQRRYDLIPNLVNTVKGYAEQEKEVFTAVTEARSRVGGAGTVPEKIEANNELAGALSRLLVVMENYPELKSNQNFLRLQDELAGTENRIAVERRRYNEAVAAYNKKIRKYPGSFVAGMKGYEKKTPFEAAPQAQAAPVVEF